LNQLCALKARQGFASLWTAQKGDKNATGVTILLNSEPSQSVRYKIWKSGND